LCGLEEETNAHLFLTYNITHKIWNTCSKWVEVSTTHHNQLKNHFQLFDLLTLNSKGNKLWNDVWFAIIKNICDHRNNIVFRQRKVDANDIFPLPQLNA